MGSAHSSEIKREVADLASTSSSDDENNDNDAWLTLDTKPSVDEDSDDDDDSDDEENYAFEERLRILEDSRKLRMMAEFFLHPEKPVKANRATACRCYFARASAPQQVSLQEDNEAAKIREDAMALKKLAVDYMHPEIPIKSSIACSRCYFDRASAPEQDLEEERAQILSEMKALKKAAYDYLHPEAPIRTDATVFGRNYFSRYSAPEFLTEGEAIERERVLKDARKLSELARNTPITVEPTFMGRNYFNRPSAPQQTTLEEEQEWQQILKDARTLKKLAVWYMHPEKPLEVDATACGRNYFGRPSAPEQEEDEYGDDREIVLEEMKELKQLASDYLHPEKPLEIDSTVCARNYFSRPSALQQEEDEYADEREIILEEMKELKKLASDYLHPEKPVEMDSTAARCYFDRPSAPVQDEMDEEEKKLILHDMHALKKVAVWYMHPEKPLQVDAVACGRNYFTRPSAPEQEEDEYCDDREIVLEEMKELKQLASDYLHPEKPLEIDSTVCARNYFTRPSAMEQEEDDYSDERAMILKDAALLKQKAVDFMHPELPVQTNPVAFGRNYFSRPSAMEQEEDDYSDERVMILKDAALLKQKAVDFMHPELPVQTNPAAYGRNYFSRPSASEYEDDEYASNHEMVHMDAAMLYHLAVDYRHPELPVKTNPAVFGRNYFNRPSAPEQEEDEYAAERALILKDAALLKQKAVDFLHPELPLQISDPTVFGRNYFSRPSAFSDVEDDVESDDEEEREHILSDAHHLEQLAMDYHHPEKPIQTVEQMETARNYYEPKFHHPHHTHFDMDDDIHLHHVEFDRNTDHHHEITQVRVTTPTAARKIVKDFDLKLAMSPGCVMTFANPKDSSAMPELPMSPGCVMSFAHPPAGEHWHPELPSLS